MAERRYHVDGSSPKPGQIFVFGSNLSGYHGGGAARAAHDHYGAEWGVYEGLTGNSYALPTVKENIAGPSPLHEIKIRVDTFLKFATEHPELHFLVTRVGCGLAGHWDEDIAPMFANAPVNCSLSLPWKPILERMF